jgi:hypothetical protein
VFYNPNFDATVLGYKTQNNALIQIVIQALDGVLRTLHCAVYNGSGIVAYTQNIWSVKANITEVSHRYKGNQMTEGHVSQLFVKWSIEIQTLLIKINITPSNAY